MELDRETRTGLNLSETAELLQYLHTGDACREIVARAQLGSTERPLAGDGIYQLDVLLNGVLLIPSSRVQLPSGQGQAIAIGRPIIIEAGDTIRVMALGLPADVSVDTETVLLDVTPLRQAEFVGVGLVFVDHNYGMVDNLRITDPAGAGLGGATIFAYLAEDYDQGRRAGAARKGQATTDAAGRWRNGMYLDPAEYVFAASHEGYIMGSRRLFIASEA